MIEPMEATSNGHAPRTYKERVCPCGIRFTPTGPRNLYHADDCPERPRSKAKAPDGETQPDAPAREPAPAKPKAKRRRRRSPAPKAQPPSGLLTRLESEVKDELQRIGLEIAAERAQFEQVEAAYKQRIDSLKRERDQAVAVGKAIAL